VKHLVLAVSLAIFGIASAGAAGNKLGYIVVDGVRSIEKLDFEVTGTGNLWPWQASEIDLGDGIAEVIISNSCGFARFSYDGTIFENLQINEPYWEFRETVDVLARLGEWCRLEYQLHEHTTLLKVRYWNETAYALGSAKIHRTADEAPYIVDEYFIEDWALSPMLKDIPKYTEGTACWDKHDTRPDTYIYLSKLTVTAVAEDVVCYSKGVFLADILADPPNQSVQSDSQQAGRR